MEKEKPRQQEDNADMTDVYLSSSTLLVGNGLSKSIC